MVMISRQSAKSMENYLIYLLNNEIQKLNYGQIKPRSKRNRKTT